MTKTFEDKRRLSLAQFARDAGQAGNETTPSSISTAVIEFARELGGEPPQRFQWQEILHTDCTAGAWMAY